MAKILIADDDLIVLKVVQATLRQANHEVVTAEDGHVATRLLSTEVFQLFISDAEMPNGISGLDLFTMMRRTPALQSMPFMLLTGLGAKKDVKRALDMGVNDYIVKPIDPSLLLAKVESLLPRNVMAYAFTEAPVEAGGNWDKMRFKISGISEQGITIVTPTPIPLNTQMVVDSPLFQAIPLQNPTLRVWACTPALGGVGYRINTNFLGLSNVELQGIRVWVRVNKMPEKKAA